MKNQKSKFYQDGVVIAEVVSFPLPGETRASIDVTTLDSVDAKEYEPGDLVDIDEIEVVIRFRPTVGQLYTDSENKTYKIELALNKDATIPYSLEFQGHINEAGKGVTVVTNNQEMKQQTIKIKISGKPVQVIES